MLIHDDIYHWEGWGGKLRLASGCCRLRIFDLKKGHSGGIAHLRPVIVLISDIPESRMSVKTVAEQIAMVLDNQDGAAQMARAALSVGRREATENIVSIVEAIAGKGTE